MDDLIKISVLCSINSTFFQRAQVAHPFFNIEQFFHGSASGMSVLRRNSFISWHCGWCSHSSWTTTPWFLIPSSKLTWQWKSTFPIGNTSSNGGFPLAMLVYRRVCGFIHLKILLKISTTQHSFIGQRNSSSLSEPPRNVPLHPLDSPTSSSSEDLDSESSDSEPQILGKLPARMVVCRYHELDVPTRSVRLAKDCWRCR